MFKFRQLAVMVAVALSLAACGTGGSASQAASQAASVAPPRVVTMEIGDGSITPASVTVTKGETVRFDVKNVSTVEVEIIFGLKTDVDADAGDSLKEAEHIAPGASGSVTFTFDGDGPYAYGDQVDDHYAKGAKGDIVLQ